MRQLEGFQSARRCNRSRSDQLVNGEAQIDGHAALRHGSRVRRSANSGARPRCHCGRLAGDGTVRNVHCKVILLGWGWERPLVTTATSRSHWFALPQTDHPVIPQNLYRMSGGATNNERFEQIGQSWLKHAFTALERALSAAPVTPAVALRAPIYARVAPILTAPV